MVQPGATIFVSIVNIDEKYRYVHNDEGYNLL